MECMRKKKAADLGDQLREAFKESGLSRFAWAKEAGLSYAIVFHFAAGTRTITLDSASKLAEVLDLGLRPAKGK